MKPLSVLIADDEENIAALVRFCVESEGNRATCVGNASGAAEAMAKEKFDLVITDILMPGGDGLDLIRHAKQAQPQARILAISGGGRVLEWDDCLKMATGFGAHYAIMKPFNRERLLQAIRETMTPRPEPTGLFGG